MLLNFSQKPSDETIESPESVDEVTEADFIPYASHFDPQTLLTKNGELLQIIKITSNRAGLEYEAADQTGAYLRDVIRKALLTHVGHDRFSFWIHTFRRRQRIEIESDFADPLSAYIDDAWTATNKWQYQYYNEVYITVLREGQSAQLLDMKDFRRTFLPSMNRAYREQHLIESHQELALTVDRLVTEMKQHFDAQVLGFTERRLDEVYLIENAGDGPQTAFFSEPLEFLGKIINLEEVPMLVKDSDLSQLISGEHELTFGFNALESKSNAGRRRYCGILTLKAYTELRPESLDQFLQLPLEYIITQSYAFCDADVALERHMEQKDVIEISGDFAAARVSGLEEMLASDEGRPIDFGQLQTNIMIIVDDFYELDAAVSRVKNAISGLGMLCIREEVRFEECFWAQLPGNFEFIRRSRPINTRRAAGLARLNHFPSGSPANNHWGEALAILPTSLKTPYFFNFHREDCGHTAVFDFNSFIDNVGTTMVNFLLAQSRRFGTRLFIFDQHAASALFVEKIQGHYRELLPKRESTLTPMTLNPLMLEDNKRNRSFLLAWIVSLVGASEQETDPMRERLKPYIDRIFELAPEQRTFASLLEMINDDDEALASRFSAWHDDGKLAGIFDSGHDNVKLAGDVHGFDLTRLGAHPQATVPVFSYLLHRVISELDGRPTIIMLNEAWLLLDNAFFLPRIQSLLQMLTQNNAMVIFYTRHIEDYADRQLTQEIVGQAATRLYVPDDVGADYFPGELKLSEQEARKLARMDRQKGGFLIKQGNESIFAELSLDDIVDVRSILSGDTKTLANAGGPFA